MPFRAPFLRYDEIRNRAEAFLAQYQPMRAIPVPIERIVESHFGIDIVPVPGLQEAFDVVAYITQDLREIRVDEFVYLRRHNRYRFSLAHELAHRVLHADVFGELSFTDIAGWKRLMVGSIPEQQYSYLEFHANSFAGLALVPPAELREAFHDFLEEGQEHGIEFDEPDTGAREAAEAHIAKLFEVSSDVVHRRIEKDRLWHD